MNIYLACGLTQVPRDLFARYTSFIHELASGLKGMRAAQIKYALVDSDPQLATHAESDRPRLCYKLDREMVEAADVLVAEASFPSTGLGIELQIADMKRKPIVLCYHDFGANRASQAFYKNPDGKRHSLQIGDGFISIMALGLPSIAAVVQHSGNPAGVSQIVAVVKDLRPPRYRQPSQPRAPRALRA